jgi:hypothetical protein
MFEGYVGILKVPGPAIFGRYPLRVEWPYAHFAIVTSPISSA